jgi:hypothetical protein
MNLVYRTNGNTVRKLYVTNSETPASAETLDIAGTTGPQHQQEPVTTEMTAAQRELEYQGRITTGDSL